MGRQLVKQPNGLWAIWSSCTDSLVGFEFDLESYIDSCIQEESLNLAIRIYQKALQLEVGKQAYHQFTQSWAESITARYEDEEKNWIRNIGKGCHADGAPCENRPPVEIRQAAPDVPAAGVYQDGLLVGFIYRWPFEKRWDWETAANRGINKEKSVGDAVAQILPDLTAAEIRALLPSDLLKQNIS